MRNLGGARLGTEYTRSVFNIRIQIAFKLRLAVLSGSLIAGIVGAGVAHAQTCPVGFIDCGSQSPQFFAELREVFDFFGEIGGAYAKVTDAVKVINKVLGFFMLIEMDKKLSDLTEKEFISDLRAELDRAIGVLEWEFKTESANRRWAMVHGALADAKEAKDMGKSLDTTTWPNWGLSIDGVEEAGGSVLFWRHLNSAETSTKRRWMEIIPDKPKPNEIGLIHDWRLALPAYLQLVALRLQVIALVDPMFRTEVAFGTKSESAYRAELKLIRNTIDREYKRIRRWVGAPTSPEDVAEDVKVVPPHLKCGTKPADPVFLIGGARFTARLACADINTGICVEYDPKIDYPVKSEATFTQAKQAFSDQLEIIQRNLQYSLESLTPLFDLQSFRDTVSLYLDTSLRDLTDPNHLIRSDDNGLCLILINPVFADPNSDAGFAVSARVGLGSCYSRYARWIYDRATRLITNESVDELSRYWGGNGVCLRAVPWDVLAPNIPVGVEDCGIAGNEDPTGRTVKWTYDPNARTLVSGAGGLLSWANFYDQNGASIGPGPLLIRPDVDSPDRSSTPPPSTQWGSTWTCSDAAIVKGSFGKHSVQTSLDPRADVNGDGVVDVRDLAFVAQLLPVGMRCP